MPARAVLPWQVRGLNELQQGFKGELTMSEHMEQLAEARRRDETSSDEAKGASDFALRQALSEQILPVWWVKLGFPSTRPLRRPGGRRAKGGGPGRPGRGLCRVGQVLAGEPQGPLRTAGGLVCRAYPHPQGGVRLGGGFRGCRG